MAQHDYVIDNSTGANVRADINSVLQAISSTNSGSSAPSTTYAFQLFANTTTSKLQIRNAANSAFVDLIGLDGSILLPDGSVSSPSLAFSDDLNTGLFSSAADTLNFTTGGVERMELGATTIFNEDGADVDFRIEGDSEANLFYVDAGNDRIGIGTASPTSKLDVAGNIALTASDPKIFFNTGGSMISNANVANTLAFFTDGTTERARIDSSGRFLIGTTTSGHSNADDLTVNNSGNCGITIRSGSSNDGNIFFADADSDTIGTLKYDHTNNAFRINTNGSEAMRIDTSGNVGIGTTSPDNTLHLVYSDSQTYNTDIRNVGLQIENNNGTDNTYAQIHLRVGNADAYLRAIREGSNLTSLAFLTDNGGATGDAGEAMRIDSSGMLLFGKTADDTTTGSGILISANGNMRYSHTGTSDHDFLEFNRGTDGSMTRIGLIRTTGSGTIYNTTSDYRLKENAVSISDGITRLKTLKPYRFNFKIDPDKIVDGFFAHEVTAVPEAITGTKDEVDADNKPVYQGIDQSKLVPLLVAAVQELIGKVEALEAA